jgi:hypothetical protein
MGNGTWPAPAGGPVFIALNCIGPTTLGFVGRHVLGCIASTEHGSESVQVEALSRTSYYCTCPSTLYARSRSRWAVSHRPAHLLVCILYSSDASLIPGRGTAAISSGLALELSLVSTRLALLLELATVHCHASLTIQVR